MAVTRRRDHHRTSSAAPGAARDEVAARLVLRLATRDVSVISYGYDSVGALVSHRLGCDDDGGDLDLTTLCVTAD